MTLTVTDTDGATGTVSHAVTAASSFVADDFNRTVTGGLGSADVGGPWTIVGNGHFNPGGQQHGQDAANGQEG